MNAMLDNILSRLGIYDLIDVLYTRTFILVTLWFSKYNNGNYIGAYQDFNMAKCIAEKNNMNGLVEMIDVYLPKLRERSF